MPVTSTGYAVESASERSEALRAQWLATFGYSVADDSLEAGTIDTFADLAFDLDSGGQSLWDAMSAYTAQGSALDRWFAGRPARRDAVASRYTFRVTATTGTVTYPEGWVVQGGGADGAARWRVVSATSVTTTPTQVVFEATTDGPIAMDSGAPTTLAIVTPITGIASVEYDPTDGDAFSLAACRCAGRRRARRTPASGRASCRCRGCWPWRSRVPRSASPGSRCFRRRSGRTRSPRSVRRSSTAWRGG